MDDDVAPFPAALARAIAGRRMTFQVLSERLASRGIKVSVATLSYWRSGRRRPERAASLEALDALEEILELPTGALRSKLGPSRRPGPPRAEISYAELLGPAAAALFAELGFGPRPLATEMSSQVIIDLRADLSIERVSWRGLWQADVDGVDRVPQLFTVDTRGDDPDPAVFTPVFGCRVGEVTALAHEGRYAAELVLDRVLERGETALIEYAVTGFREVRDTSCDLALNRRTNELVLWVRVHVDAPRLTYESYTRIDGHETVTPLEAPSNSAHLVLRSFGPGRCGIRWSHHAG